MTSEKRLALVAGSGALPPRAIAAAREAGWQVRVLSVIPRDDLAEEKPFQIKVSRPDQVLKEIRAFKATHVCAVGAMHLGDRDRETLAAFAGDTERENKGDGKLSQLGGQLLKMLGIPFIGVHEIVSDLLAPEGVLGAVQPDEFLETTMRHAFAAVRRAGELDLGQALVVSGARIVATEDIAGTDALIARIEAFRKNGLIGEGAARLVLAKSSKPGQPVHIDLPAIGPDTITNATAAGIAGIVVEAGHTLLIEREDLISAANRAGIAIMGIRVDNG
ncbi:LpxI family protein [Pelagibacterium sediminicola]|uniref:LpxI family protein n=1 Tax=Pelagibacterium sediminicola TaxID=2248761 RepID=UPI000E31C06A|nr:UDP-2,3-diacylglucosamine diphosphatase LpxI [Pelagibacterium sediminicola]